MIAELNKMHQISLFWRKNKMLLMSQQLNSKAAFKATFLQNKNKVQY